MPSVLDAFGIQDQTILTDKDRLRSYLALDENGGGDTACSKALVSTVVTLVGVVYSMQSRLESLERESRGNRRKGASRASSVVKRPRRGGSASEDAERKYRAAPHVSVELRKNGKTAEGEMDDEGDNADSDDSKVDGFGVEDDEDDEDEDDTEYEGADLDEEDSDDDGEEDVGDADTDESEGDLDDDLDAVFDSTSVDDAVEHAVPVNFTYSYKPQQVTNMKIPANGPAGEKSGRTISVINWTDVPLSQVALKYNVSKSVIGPTLQVLRDFEKRNTKALQETIKRNRAATEERKLHKPPEKAQTSVDIVENGSGRHRKTNGDARPAIVSAQSVRGRRRGRRPLSSHKLRLRLRRRGANGGGRRSEEFHDESSSESVYDPNYRSEEDEKENRQNGSVNGNGEVKEKEKEQAVEVKDGVPLSTLENGVGKRPAPVDGEVPNGTLKKVKFGDEVEHSKGMEDSAQIPAQANGTGNIDGNGHVRVETPPKPKARSKPKQKVGAGAKLSNSLYSLLQSASTSQADDELLGSVTVSPVSTSTSVSTVETSEEQVPSFAYALTSNGLYQCKSRGCEVKPFSQYIQLYKHKSTQHPQELPS